MNTDFNERWDFKMGFVGIIVSALLIGSVYLWEKFDVTNRYTEYWKSKHQTEITK
jgi:hypothetical protein